MTNHQLPTTIRPRGRGITCPQNLNPCSAINLVRARLTVPHSGHRQRGRGITCAQKLNPLRQFISCAQQWPHASRPPHQLVCRLGTEEEGRCASPAKRVRSCLPYSSVRSRRPNSSTYPCPSVLICVHLWLSFSIGGSHPLSDNASSCRQISRDRSV